MLDVLLRIKHLCSGLPWQQMCGFIRVRGEGGLCKEMQQQWGKWVILRFEITRSCFQLDSNAWFWINFTAFYFKVCNHKRECHCNPGWAPPYCDIQYADLPQGTQHSRHSFAKSNVLSRFVCQIQNCISLKNEGQLSVSSTEKTKQNGHTCSSVTKKTWDLFHKELTATICCKEFAKWLCNCSVFTVNGQKHK